MPYFFVTQIVRKVIVPLHRTAGWLLDRADSIENRLLKEK